MEEIKDEIRNIIESIESLDGENLRKIIIDSHPYDVSSALIEVSEELRDKVLQLLSPSEAADILEYLDTEESADILEDMDSKKSSSIISEMEVDDAVDVINALDDDIKNEVIEHIDEEIKQDIIELSKYSDDEAGSIMTDKFLSLDVSMSVSNAMQRLVKESNDQEVIDFLFVLDNNILVGIIELKDLIIARKNEKIKDLMDSNFKYINAHDYIRDATDLITEYNLFALPVLDDNKELLGIITIDDAIDYVDEDVSEDYDKMAGIVGENSIGFLDVIKSRLLWLIILLLLSFVVSSVMDGFAFVIQSVTCLVFFQSLILDMSGNAGTQSLATTIVNLSRNELDSSKLIRKHLLKELFAGFIDSIILGIAAFALSFVFIKIRGIEGFSPISLSLVIGLAMMCALLISNFLGSLVPIILFKCHVDPAVASGPFISTLNDIVSVSIYYLLAWIIIVGGLL